MVVTVVAVVVEVGSSTGVIAYSSTHFRTIDTFATNSGRRWRSGN
jgi:hypothetical protein